MNEENLNSPPIIVEEGVTIEPLSLAPADMDYAKAWGEHRELVDKILSSLGFSREQFEEWKEQHYSSLTVNEKSLAFTSTEELRKRQNQQWMNNCLSTVVTPCNPEELLVDTPIIVEDRK